MSERPWTTCKTCGRVIYVEDVDKDGRCCYCPVKPVTKPKES